MSTKSTTPRNFEQVIGECIKTAQDQIASLRGLVALIREANKTHEREVREVRKQLAKKTRRKRSVDENGVEKPKQDTGFAKPCRISKEMADFLKNVAGKQIDPDQEFKRADVTNWLSEYFKENKLRDEKDQRILLYKNDPKTAPLFKNMPKDQKLTYFTLQRALKENNHFIK